MNGYEDYYYEEDWLNYDEWGYYYESGGGYEGPPPDLSFLLQDIQLPETGIEFMPFEPEDLSYYIGTGLEPVTLQTLPDNWDDFWQETANQLDSSAVESAAAAMEAGKNPVDWLSENALAVKPPGSSIWDKIGNFLGGIGGGGGGGTPSPYSGQQAGMGSALPKDTVSNALLIGSLGLGAITLLRKK